MCVYSMVVDHRYDQWKKRVPQPNDFDPPVWVPPTVSPMVPPFVFPNPMPSNPRPAPITDEEIEEFRDLLDRARKYDKDNSEPDCETEQKKHKLRELARELGIEDKISFV